MDKLFGKKMKKRTKEHKVIDDRMALLIPAKKRITFIETLLGAGLVLMEYIAKEVPINNPNPETIYAAGIFLQSYIALKAPHAEELDIKDVSYADMTVDDKILMIARAMSKYLKEKGMEI